MKLHTRTNDDILIFTIDEPRLDTSISPLLKGELSRMIKESSLKKFLIDLTAVESCDSTGLSVLLVANHSCSDKNSTLRIVASSEKVTSLIQITRLDQVLRVVRTQDDAFAAFRND